MQPEQSCPGSVGFLGKAAPFSGGYLCAIAEREEPVSCLADFR
ncbi:hypothetical protein EVA_19533 [gut metagenome]|uniref:Uncharacterized protein n=1 Tax=gut metagenome TaxID=749906 RepID=J9FBT6_9ZZZZ